jgi:DNA-binding NtrC family response regulator
MAVGKRLLVFSSRDPKAVALQAATAEWGCLATCCESLDELRGRVEGAEHDMVLIEPSSALRKLLSEATEPEQLKLPLAEVEKRHIQRVLASTGGNKTRAARILGIDTKTLYNKLKSYKSSEQVARKRLTTNGAMPAAN